MSEYILLISGALSLGIGAILGYFARQTVGRFQVGSIEQTLQKRLSEAKQEAQNILLAAKEKAFKISEEAKKQGQEKIQELENSRRILERKQGILDQRISDINFREKRFKEKIRKVKALKENLEKLKEEKEKELEKISGLSREEAQKELFAEIEQEQKKEILERLSKLENEGEERFKRRAEEILATVIQRQVSNSLRDLSTTAVPLPDEEIKGRIIGKEGRNIKAFENATNVELIVDDTPDAVFLSSFDPLRREIAKISLEKLMRDGRIQPARIEEIVNQTQKEMPDKIEKIGEEAAFEAGVYGLDPKLHQLLGRLKFRYSFGQNVLDHSLEVASLSRALAEEIGADARIAKTAGLLHDIGKAIDSEVEGSHVEIGIKILQKFGVEEEVIKAMKSHHEEYPYESVEAIIVQTADAISASRPGARKDNVENYLKRLEELEKVATSFPEVEKAYAIQAGREIRVFVRPEEVDDFGAKKLARDIARAIEEELTFSGEIKVNVIRETRIIEHAR